MNIKSLAGLLCLQVLWSAQAAELKLANRFVAFDCQADAGHVRPVHFEDRINGRVLPLAGDCFQVELGDGTVLKSSRLDAASPARIEALAPEIHSSTQAKHFAGKQIVARFSVPDQ